ncbi:MAG: type II toxin-antitoxin system RatA family toxin [Gammaproteobacteria bacterium]
MAVINRHALVPYEASKMFDLVNDIASYPSFLPWCTGATVHEQTEDEIKATLVLSWGGMEKSFTTHNRLQKNKMIEMRLIEGPFSHLEGFWRFENIDDTGTKVQFDMDFEFSSKILSFAFGPIFTQVTGNLVDSFCKRADELYASQS